jgi:hypothetical protein
MCGCGGSPTSGAVTSAEVAEGRFKVTRVDGQVQYFTSYQQAVAYQNTNGGHLDVNR